MKFRSTPKKEKEIISLSIKEKKFLKILSDPLNGNKFYQLKKIFDTIFI